MSTKKADDGMLARHEEGKSMTLDEVTKGMSPEDAAKFKAEHDKNKDKFKGKQAKAKKQVADWMYVISKDSAGGYLVTLGAPTDPRSKIKFRATGDAAREEMKAWVRDNVGRRISPNHVIDLTGLRLVPEDWDDFFLGTLPDKARMQLKLASGAWQPPKLTKGLAAQVAKALDKFWTTEVKSLDDIRRAIMKGILKPMPIREVVDNKESVIAWAHTLNREQLIQFLRWIEEAHWKGRATQYSTSEETLRNLHASDNDLLAELDSILAEGCPDNLDPAECKEWESNTDKYRNVVKDQHKSAGAVPAEGQALSAMEKDWAKQHLLRHRGERLFGTPYKFGQRVQYDGRPWLVYDHEAEGNTSRLVLISPNYGTMISNISLDLTPEVPLAEPRMAALDAMGLSLLAKGCPDNLSDSECKEWEANTEKYRDVVKDQYKRAFKEWDRRFFGPEQARNMGDRRFDYLPFNLLDAVDQRKARAMYPHKSVGAMYDFRDEHYLYPVNRAGQLSKGRRVLGIPLELIKDADFMASLGYEMNPGWPKAAAHSYLIGVNHRGEPMVDGMLDPVLFAMIIYKALGLNYTAGMVGGSDRKMPLRGMTMRFEEALATAVAEEPGLFQPGSGGHYRISVSVGSIYEKGASELDALEFGVLTASLKAASQVGQIIMEQLGGVRRLTVMLGMYYLQYLPNGVEFGWPNKQVSKGNHVRVVLNPDDTYDLSFFATRWLTVGRNRIPDESKLVKKYEGIYADMMGDLFYRQTGWALRLASENETLDEAYAQMEKFTDLGEDAIALEELANGEPVGCIEDEPDPEFELETMLDDEVLALYAMKTASGEPDSQGRNWKLVTNRGPKRWLWDDGTGDVFFQVVEAEGPGMPIYSLRVLDRSGFLGGQGAFRFRRSLKKPQEAFARARVLYKALSDLRDPEKTVGGGLDLTQEWVTTQWEKVGSYEEGQVTEKGYEPGQVVPDPAATESAEGSQIPDGSGDTKKRADLKAQWGRTIAEGPAKQAATTPEGAKSEFERYKEKHPSTKKTPKDFLDEGGKDKGEGEKKEAPKTSVPHKDLGTLLDGWHGSAGDPIYEVASNARSGKPVPVESAKKALSDISMKIEHADAYRIEPADVKQLQKAKKLLEKMTKQGATAPSTVAGWLAFEE